MPGIQATPQLTVDVICDRVGPRLLDPSLTFFEPGCGDGNFLATVFSRRLAKISTQLSADALQNQILLTLSKIYAVEINSALLRSARQRLRTMAINFLGDDLTPDYRFVPLLDQILTQNLLQADFLAAHHEIILPDWHYVADFNFTFQPVRLIRRSS